mgnify:FL=1
MTSSDDTTVVHLNVGGQRYTTQLGTLRRYRGSVLASMFSPPFAIHQDSREGSFFLDRNGDVFGLVLDYLRSGILVVPRNPERYATLRREIAYYGLPVVTQLPDLRPLAWEEQPVRFLHAHIVLEDIEKSISWEEGALPADLHHRSLTEIVRFFASRGYRMASEYTSRGTKGFISVWMLRDMKGCGAEVALEVTDQGPR